MPEYTYTVYNTYLCTVGLAHRRRINTEEKAKVVAAAGWGTEFIQFLATLVILQ